MYFVLSNRKSHIYSTLQLKTRIPLKYIYTLKNNEPIRPARLQGSTPHLAQMFHLEHDQVLLHFMWIQNPKWPRWPLIGWHIFNFFSSELMPWPVVRRRPNVNFSL